MLGPVWLIRSPFLRIYFPPFSISFSLKPWMKTAINKYVWPCQREKDYCISIQLKCGGWAVEHRLSRQPAFYRSEALQQAVAPRLFKMSARRNFRKRCFGPARNLWNSSVLTTRSYNITGLHVINVRSPLQGLRFPRFSSSTTEVFIRGFMTDAVCF